MKTLIKNEFLYYQKNSSKLVLSILFILSFFVMLNVYDNFELQEINKESHILRREANEVEFPNINSQKIYNIYNKMYQQEYDDSIEITPAEIALLEEYEQMNAITNETGTLFRDFATLHARGRMNQELTPYREIIYRNILEIYQKSAKLSDDDSYLLDRYQDIPLLKIKHQQALKLLDSETPDNFNYYTTTFANYPSKVFEGSMLLVTLVIVLLLFYDLFSKDFEHLTYKTIYTNPYPRNKIIKAKLLFAILYTLLLITIGIVIVSVYLLFVRRSGYNVLDNRQGFIFHPEIINVNPLTILNQKPIYILIPVILKNIISILLGLSIIILWILLIVNISFKLKSSNSTLTILTFALIATFFINSFNFNTLFQYIFPIFAYPFDNIIVGLEPINMYYLFIVTNLYNYFLYKYINRDISKMDLLDGDYNA